MTLLREVVQLDQRGHVFARDNTVDITLYRLYAQMDKEHPGRFPRARLEDNFECAWCGERPKIVLDETGTEPVVRAMTACSVPDGFKTVFELKVPSGRVVIDDDLRDVYNLSDEEADKLPSLNVRRGTHETSLAFAAIGCAHGYVGNSCPGFYKVGAGQYVIANSGSTDDDVEIPIENGVKLAQIVTDLWWYSIADYDDFIARGGDPKRSWCRNVVSVPPGTYRFIHHTNERGFNFDEFRKPVIYAHIERVGT